MSHLRKKWSSAAGIKFLRCQSARMSHISATTKRKIEICSCPINSFSTFFKFFNKSLESRCDGNVEKWRWNSSTSTCYYSEIFKSTRNLFTYLGIFYRLWRNSIRKLGFEYNSTKSLQRRFTSFWLLLILQFLVFSFNAAGLSFTPRFGCWNGVLFS